LAFRVIWWHMRNSKFKLMSHFGPYKLEINFIFFVGTSELLTAPKVIQQCMRNLSLSLVPIWDPSLSLGFFLFVFIASLANLLSNSRVIR
jgi:hypothetical protein